MDVPVVVGGVVADVDGVELPVLGGPEVDDGVVTGGGVVVVPVVSGGLVLDVGVSGGGFVELSPGPEVLLGSDVVVELPASRFASLTMLVARAALSR